MRHEFILMAAAAGWLAASSFQTLEVEAAFIRGDADQDGALGLGDPVSIIGVLFLGAGDLQCRDAADADDSGRLDVSDPIALLAFLFLGSAAPPAPYPACGADPTADALDCASAGGGPCGVLFPDGCNNVVARTATRGCGRVLVWGDDTVTHADSWGFAEPFWRNAIDWLSTPDCGGARRWRIALEGISTETWPEFEAFLELEGLTVLPWEGPQTLSSVDILVGETVFLRPETGGGEIQRWVEGGGAFMTYSWAFTDRQQDRCVDANSLIEPLGLRYDCFHESPRGPITLLESHPLTRGLSLEAVPFVFGTRVLDVEGLDVEGSRTEVVARAGDECSPAEVIDCRFPIVYDGRQPGDTLEVESDCRWHENGGVNAPRGLELNVLSIYRGDTAEVAVRVERAEPMVLVLSAYEPVNWVLDLGPRAAIELVILSGYRPQSLAAPPDIPFESHDFNQDYLGSGFGYDCDGGNTVELITNLESLTGLHLRSFHGCSFASAFTIR
jgi:hypothetical protein